MSQFKYMSDRALLAWPSLPPPNPNPGPVLAFFSFTSVMLIIYLLILD